MSAKLLVLCHYPMFQVFDKTYFYVKGKIIFILLFRCSSPVGRKFRNDISLGRNCWKKGVVMHEIAHSLGKTKLVKLSLVSTNSHTKNVRLYFYVCVRVKSVFFDILYFNGFNHFLFLIRYVS